MACACAVKRVYHKLPDAGANDFTLHRACMDRCKEDEMTRCCLTNLCNGSATMSASITSASLRLALSVAAVLAVCLHRLIYFYAS